MPPDSERADEFRSYPDLLEGNLFEELLASVVLEDVGKGRRGAVLVKIDETGRLPLVRTTTKYHTPAQPFRSVHERLAQQIQQRASLSVGFNNALLEIYTNAYTTMGSHSDQALDLADESFIALFSCYQHPERVNPPRKLLVESKESGGTPFAIPLTHQSVVVFSVDINRRFRHKIVLDPSPRTPENQWLGLTFRTSKSLMQFRDGEVFFPNDTRLTLANDEQRREFYHLRSRENRETDFIYPRIMYTISGSDLLPPIEQSCSCFLQSDTSTLLGSTPTFFDP